MTINLPINGTLAEQGGEIIRATLSGQIPRDMEEQLITARIVIEEKTKKRERLSGYLRKN